MKHLLYYSVLLLLGATLMAQEPRIDEVRPGVLQTDAATVLELAGSDLDADGRLSLRDGGPYEVGNLLIPSGISGVFCDGSKVYVSFYDTVTKLGGIQVLDVSDPSNPTEMGRFELGDSASSVVVRDGYAFMPFLNPYTFIGGMHVVDVQQPETPIRIETYNTLTSPQSMAFRDELVFIADSSSGLQIIDVADLAAPVLAGSADTPGISWDVALAGDLAFIADGFMGLQVIDISDPTTPALIGGYTPAGSFSFGVAASGSTVYLADFANGLLILDVSNPASPVEVGRFATPEGATGATVNGSKLYVTDGLGGLHVLDISQTTEPRWLGGYKPSGSSSFMFGVEVEGDLAFVTDTQNGLRIVDVRRPSAPAPLWQAPSADEALDVAVEGDLAFVADGAAGLAVFDLAAEPVREVARLATTGSAQGITLAGDLAAVSLGSSGVELIDVSDPSAPASLGRWDTSGSAMAAEIVGDFLYVADDRRGLQIADVSDPTLPTRVGGFDTRGRALDVRIVDGLAFVADDNRGVRVMDVSDPGAPREIGDVSTPGRASGLALEGDLLLVADRSRGLQAIDVSDPTSPRLLGDYIGEDRAAAVAVSGGLALLSDGLNGVKLLDLSDPAEPKLVAAHETPGRAGGVTLFDDGSLLVADGVQGLRRIAAQPVPGALQLTADGVSAEVPAGLPSGPYDVIYEASEGATAVVANAVVACAGGTLASGLTPRALPGLPIDWYLEVSSGRDLAGLSARALLPAEDLSAEPLFVATQGPSTIDLLESSEGWVVRLSGADEAGLRALWAQVSASGGFPLEAAPDGAFGPIAVQDGLPGGPVLIEPMAFGAGALPVQLEGPATAYRFRVDENGRLVAAGMRGTDTDLLFELSAGEAPCRSANIRSWRGAISNYCRQSDPMDLARRRLCGGPLVGRPDGRLAPLDDTGDRPVPLGGLNPEGAQDSRHPADRIEIDRLRSLDPANR